jgi:thiamine-phosphate pyrophosphorylase
MARSVDRSVLRILDANANRAREGLRVAEEYARFVIERPALAAGWKDLRHGLAEALALLERGAGGPVRRGRDTPGDIGTAIHTESEARRTDAAQTALAAAKRAQEALRALEEYGKILSPEAATRFGELRYRAYDMESRMAATPDRAAALRDALLYVLVTESLASTDGLTAAREAVAGGADIIQMREKELEDADFHRRAEAMAAICREGGALFIVNDRPHIATLVGADGVHTGQGDLPVHLIRRILGPDRIVGRSTHGPDQLAEAATDGADYVGVGPVHETQTKQHREAVGLPYVRHAVANAAMPYFCIGSINRQTLGEVLDAGARAVAVCTGVIAAADIAAEASWFRERVAARRQ